MIDKEAVVTPNGAKWSFRGIDAGALLWTTFAFVAALLMFPGTYYSGGVSVGTRALICAIVAVFGLIIEALAVPNARWSTSLRWLRRNPLALLAVIFGIWTIIASLASQHPSISLLGAIGTNGESALWYIVMVALFLGAYRHCQRRPATRKLLALAVVSSASIVALVGVVEVVLGHSVIRDAFQVPVVTFPGAGHLAGYFVLAIWITVSGLWRDWNVYLLLCLLVLTVGLGVTVNRTGIGVALISPFVLWLLTRRWKGAVVLGIVSGLALGFGLAKVVDAPTRGERSLAAVGSLKTREYLWRSASRAILAQPVFGWGGGDIFSSVWHEFLPFEEVDEFMRLEFGIDQLVAIEGDEFPSIFIYRDATGNNRLMTVTRVHAHNQLLDIGKMWGLVGVLLYCGLLAGLLPGAFSGQPLSIAVLGIHMVYILWFSVPEIEPTMWLIWGAGVVSVARRPGDKRLPEA